MKVYLKEGFEYIPTYNGNREANKSDQMKIKFRFLSGSDAVESYGDDGKIDQLKEWLFICDEVINFEVNDKPITPEDIFKKPGLMELYTELKLAYKLEAIIDKKKS